MPLHPAFIFDLDGTLVDTAPDLLAATNAVLMAHGHKAVDPKTLRHLVGYGAARLIEDAFAATGAPVHRDLVPGLVDEFIAHYRGHIADHSKIFPGVEVTLAHLRMAEARLGVLTNKPQELTDLLLPALGLTSYFDAVYGAGRMGYNKPDARIFHDVVRDLGGGAEGPAIMIGDSLTDVKTARAAGVPIILVNYGYTPEPAETLGADAVTGDFRDIPKLAAQLLG
jgi:phosphoglycolate phosphatase